MDEVTTAFVLTGLAGLSTGIGSLIAYFIPGQKLTQLSVLLGFAAGAMIYISFVELLAGSVEDVGFFLANTAFFTGMFLGYFLDRLVGHMHLDALPDGNITQGAKKQKLQKTGFLTAIGIAMHNFPEGMAVLVTSLSSPHLGAALAAAVAIHNIPEGIAVSVPIYWATGNRKKAFLYSFLAGISEPLGAAVGYFLLFRFLDPGALGIILAAVGGIMLFICFDELLPIALRWGNEHLVVLGLFSGMAVMALSLNMLS